MFGTEIKTKQPISWPNKTYMQTLHRIFLPVWVLLFSINGLQAQKVNEADCQELMATYRVPAMSIAVVRNGKLAHSGAYGVEANDTHLPINKETIFEAASLSKPLFAYAFLKLISQGKIKLDQPLYTYLPYEDASHDERYKKMTARMLLSHSGGFPNWRQNGKLEVLFEPGDRWSYSGEGYVYLMRVAETVTGQSMEELMQSLVLEPLGMNNTSYVWQEKFEKNYAAPHDFLGNVMPKGRPNQGNAAYSLHTTAEDYAKFMIAFMNQEGLSKSLYQEAINPQIMIDKDKELGWGLGLGTQQTRLGRGLMQWGDNGTFRAYLILYPEDKNGMVFFTNSNNGLKLVPSLTRNAFADDHPAFDALDYPLQFRPYERLIQQSLEIGFSQAIKIYLTTNQFHQDTSLINEGYMNWVGYQFMNMGRLEDAKQVFRYNLNAYPESANAHDSYAEACLKSGALQEAMENYAKAYAMDNSYKNAKAISERLSNKPEGNVVMRLPAYPHATTVFVAGSFNNWNQLTLPMIKEKGEWRCPLQLEPGTYEYKFIIDGIWTIDPNNPAIKNNDGNINSVLEVKEQ